MKKGIEQDKAPLVMQDQLLREITRLRGDLLTVAVRVSHDLRTPMGGIVNTGELLKDVLVEKEPAAAELTNALFTSVDEMTRLIGLIRFVAKASAEPKPNEPGQHGRNYFGSFAAVGKPDFEQTSDGRQSRFMARSGWRGRLAGIHLVEFSGKRASARRREASNSIDLAKGKRRVSFSDLRQRRRRSAG